MWRYEVKQGQLNGASVSQVLNHLNSSGCKYVAGKGKTEGGNWILTVYTEEQMPTLGVGYETGNRDVSEACGDNGVPWSSYNRRSGAVGLLRTWQKELADRLRVAKPGTLLVACDPAGQSGKTWMAEWLRCNMGAQIVPGTPLAEDMMGLVFNNPAGLYVFDIPRVFAEECPQIWSCVEQVQDGTVYDRKNGMSLWLRERPIVVVLTNRKDVKGVLSPTRYEMVPVEAYDEA